MNIVVHIVPARKDNYCYIVHRQGMREAFAVDPSDAEPINEALDREGLKLTHILNTHHHHDHIGGNDELKNKWSCEIWCSHVDRDRIPHASRGLRDDENASANGVDFHILSIPGHTKGQIAIYIPEAKCVFVGDTLFSMGCGRIFEGTAVELHASLGRLSTLPEKTILYVGHEYTERNGAFALIMESSNSLIKERIAQASFSLSQRRIPSPPTLADEKKVNPFLRLQQAEIRENVGCKMTDSTLEVFTRLRLKRDQF